MITKNDILKMVHKIHRHNRGLSDRRIIHPSREWGFAVIFFLTLTISGMVVSGYLYSIYNNIENTIDTPSSGVARYDTASMERALETYRRKAEIFSTFSQGSTAPLEVTSPLDDTEDTDEASPPVEEVVVPEIETQSPAQDDSQPTTAPVNISDTGFQVE